MIELDGREYTGHDQKTNILYVFYHNLVGCVRDTNWAFQLESLYPEGPLPLQQLDTPFTTSEIQTAVRHMHSTASPGPDGFGPSFFKATWSITSQSLAELFHAFYTNDADLERINRSYLVLLPKKNNAREDWDF